MTEPDPGGTDDDRPTVSINDAAAVEGSALVFDITLSNPSAETIVLDLTTTSGTATDGIDYENQTFEYSTDGGTTWLPTSGVNGTEVTTPANSTGIQVRIDSTTDANVELDETFQLSVDSIVSGTVASSSDTGTGTITDDDAAVVSIDDVSVSEGDAGTTTYTLTVSIDNPVDADVTMNWATAHSSTDDTDLTPQSGTVTITAGSTSATIGVTVETDTDVELDETFLVNLSNINATGRDVTFAVNQGQGTIISDDAALISIDDVSQTEGNSGTTDYTFTISLDEATDVDVDVDWDTVFATATGSDFTAQSGTATITAGTTSTTVTVNIDGDTTVELDETFNVVLSNAQASGA